MIKIGNIRMITFNLIGPIITDNGSSRKLLKNILEKHNINDNFTDYYSGIKLHNYINLIVNQQFRGDSSYDLVKNIKPYKSPIEKELLVSNIHKEYIEKLKENYFENDNIFVDNQTIDILHKLRQNDIKITITTNIPSNITKHLIREHELQNVINGILCDDQVQFGKPSSEMIEILMNENNVNPNETMKVSNTIVDILEGKNANVKYNVALEQDGFDCKNYNPSHYIKNLGAFDFKKNQKDIFITDIINNMNPIWAS